MQTLAELDLPHLVFEDPTFASNPLPHFAAARAKHPWLATSNHGYIVHEFRAIRDLYSMDDKMRPAFDGIVEHMEARGTPWGRFTEEQMIGMPNDDHRRLRDAFAAKFTPRYANSLRPVMQATVKRLLDEWAPKGKFDFEEFASYFPISVMFSMVGAPHEEIKNIRHSLETMGLAFSLDKTRVPALQKAYLQIEDFAKKLMADRRAAGEAGKQDDLLDMLIAAGDSGTIPERQLIDMIIFLFVAGYDTSKNVLTYMMYTLLQYPEVYQRCATDYEYCRQVLEEALRYFNPSTTHRFTSEDVVYRDVLLPKNTMLLFMLNISGHDPITFPNPETFDPTRKIDPDKRHVAFGIGRHMCLGQYIARAQLQEGLHQIAQRLRNPRVAGEYGWRPFLGIWGLKGLPIEYTPAPAA